MTFAFSGRDVRVVIQKGNPWWIATDVCSMLGIANPRQVISRLEADERNTVRLVDGKRGTPLRNIVSEAGLHSLILCSDKKEASTFRRWVTHEVLPTIRKTGSYSVSTDPKNIQETLRACADALDSKEEIIREQDEILTLNRIEGDSTGAFWCSPRIWTIFAPDWRSHGEASQRAHPFP